jgi:hypothetical protein
VARRSPWFDVYPRITGVPVVPAKCHDRHVLAPGFPCPCRGASTTQHWKAEKTTKRPRSVMTSDRQATGTRSPHPQAASTSQSAPDTPPTHPEIRNTTSAYLLFGGISRSEKQGQIYLEGAYVALSVAIHARELHHSAAMETLDFLREHLEEKGAEFGP